MPESRRLRRKKQPREFACVACQGVFAFCWTCPCGFMMCHRCMQENLWGMTCNNITWTCPDCGAVRSFGNQ